MAKRIMGYAIVAAIVAVALFAGCVEEEAPTPISEPAIADAEESVEWSENDTERVKAFAQKVVVELEEPLQKKQWDTMQARHSTLNEEYAEIVDWLYDDKWNIDSVPQVVWEFDTMISVLLHDIRIACDYKEENDRYMAELELENALNLDMRQIKSLLRTGYYTSDYYY